jgi:hypothetical protein
VLLTGLESCRSSGPSLKLGALVARNSPLDCFAPASLGRSQPIELHPRPVTLVARRRCFRPATGAPYIPLSFGLGSSPRLKLLAGPASFFKLDIVLPHRTEDIQYPAIR